MLPAAESGREVQGAAIVAAVAVVVDGVTVAAAEAAETVAAEADGTVAGIAEEILAAEAEAEAEVDMADVGTDGKDNDA